MKYLEVPECLLCAVESRFNELRKFGVKDPRAYSEVSLTMSRVMGEGRSPLFVETFNTVIRVLGREDPHESEKRELEELGALMAQEVERRLGDDLIGYFEVAAAANSVDVPMRDYQFDISDFVDQLFERARWINVSGDGLLRVLSKELSIGYVVDNSGEFQIDKLLIKELTKRGHRVTVYARGRAYEVDVTADYVRESLSVLRNVTVVSTGNNYPAFFSEKIRESLSKHDLVIVKGVGNLEAYLENNDKLNIRPLFLFRVKCGPMIRLFNVPKGTPVIYTPTPI
ncbi:ARMT1-like domain-containing protein [Vulcanisaeta thermophila]|uniref:ARMT1-like domain-containing protein n=1 Tax=Vulcanisaeta thermophila TaxID=867917 RepID=UPI000853E02C|nr:ARMT1-like domain-containing protein [Vulcanisaeta thermophila]